MNPDAIDWRSVTSSNISAIAMHEDHLYVMFTNGGVYRYQQAEGDEPPTSGLYSRLVEADDDPDLSVGSAFHALIRGKVPGEKVEPG